MCDTWLESQGQEVSHSRVAGCTAAWVVRVTLVKDSLMLCNVSRTMANYWIWLKNLNIWALVF